MGNERFLIILSNEANTAGRTHISGILTALILAVTGCTAHIDPTQKSGIDTTQFATASSPAPTAVPVLLSDTGTATAQCLVTVDQPVSVYPESAPDAASVSGDGGHKPALARTNDGWLGIDLGAAQTGSPGREHLGWYRTNGLSLTFNPAGCENRLPIVLSMQSLQNSTYRFDRLGQKEVTLTDGRYTNPNFVSGISDAKEVHDTFMGDTFAFGDLNGDGAQDSLVVLNTNTGGSGTFVEMWPVLNVDGGPKPGGSIYIGDRSRVERLVIQEGVVTTTVIVPGLGDPMCCPSHRETWTLKLVDDVLVKQ